MRFIQKTIFILSSFWASAFGVQAQTVEAVNDFGGITVCNFKSVTIPILDNDKNLCADPVVKIVSYNKNIASVHVTTPGNELQYDVNCLFKSVVNDSVKYSVTCGSEIDTATVYIVIDQISVAPGVDFDNQYSKTCLKENDVFEHTATVRNNCDTDISLALGLHFYNQGVSVLHEIAQVTRIGTVKDFEHINEPDMQVINFTLEPGAEIQVVTKYHITKITTGKYETNFAELRGVTFEQREIRYIHACPDRELTITSCDPVPTADVAIFCSSSPSYSVSQPSSGSATIDANGIFSYTRTEPMTMGSEVLNYTATCSSGSPVTGQIVLNLLPCVDEPSVSSTYNNLCSQDSCIYSGSGSPILINEVMITPKKYNGAIYGKMAHKPLEMVGGESVELYNTNHCYAFDISGYILGNATLDNVIPEAPDQLKRGVGAVFVIPQGTVIPPMGFCVLRSKDASPVDPFRLVQNGGNTVEIIIDNHLSRLYLNNGGTRFWLPDEGSWIGFYDNSGTPLDAVHWGPSNTDICADCSPGIISGISMSSLDSLDGFSISRKAGVFNSKIDGITQSGNSLKRIPDGGGWAVNILTPPTIGYCNGTCNTRFQNTCNGTATVNVTGGSGNYSFLWDNGQTGNKATGLCEGTYCLTITDNITQLKKIVCVTVKDDPRCHDLDLKPVTENINSCIITSVSVNALKNSTLFISPDKPTLQILSGPSHTGAMAAFDDNGILSYTFPESLVDFRDQIYYELSINGMTRRSTVTINHKRNAPEIANLKVDRNGVATISIKNGTGTSPFVYILDDDPSTATSDPVFRNLPEGEHTLLVTDKNLCTVDTAFEVLPQCPAVIPDKFFTPDGNGINDVWTIVNLDCYSYHELEIYDRHGKILRRYKNDFKSWDGKYRGKLMPSTDYWFKLDIEEVEGSVVGHFTLMRR